MGRAWTTTILAGLCATMLACPSGEAPRQERQGARSDSPRDTRAAAQRDSAAATSERGPRGVLALGASWTALEAHGESLAIVERCFGDVPTLTLALDSAPSRVHRFYGQDAEVFEVGTRQEDDTLLQLEITTDYYVGPGTLRLVVRDRARGVVEVSQDIGGQRRPSELFVSAPYAAGFRRIPRPADCGLP